MKGWLRRLRGILGTGGLWGVGGAILGSAMGLGAAVLTGGGVVAWMLDGALQFGVLGALTGAGFASILTALDGRKTLEELSIGRLALWGGIAGLILPAVAWFVSGSTIPPLAAILSVALCSGVAGWTVLAAKKQAGLAPPEDTFLATAVVDSRSP